MDSVGGGVVLLGMVSSFSKLSTPLFSGDLKPEKYPSPLNPAGGIPLLLCSSPWSSFGRIFSYDAAVAMDVLWELIWRRRWSVGVVVWLGMGWWAFDWIGGEWLIGGERSKWVGQIWKSAAWCSSSSFRSTRTVGAVVFLVPIVFCISTGVGSNFSTGVGSSFVALTVFWTVGVGSGWSFVLLFVSTGLLCGFLLRNHVTGNHERLHRCLVLGCCATPKGVVFFGPSGIIRLLTVLVSGPSTGGFAAYGGNNLWSILRLDGLVLALYVIFVSVIVFLTLIIYHMFIVD